ncbi:heme o synthase [Paludifilum halophilum]|uniref:Protoheme IX farnesyltransferase n=1 Tax=Paludifilum halophilum TaxID=1642702 RepID=A0A235B4X0_9BACL|nr:heme o synthase [Paludifilum halophilum]OYD07009.1 protoheme IX farnesyltransferase [Paludifilum halophilum]
MERPMTRESSGRILAGDEQPFSTAKATWRDYWDITKPGINRANLIAVFAGFWLAGHETFDFGLLMVTLLGTALVIAGGCVVNNFIDRDIDPLMTRTCNRPVAAGRIRPQTALWMGVVYYLSGAVLLALLVNALTALLASLGFFIYVIVYSAWSKRTTPWNTLIGSVSGAVPPLVGWAAVTGSLDAAAWILFMFMFIWQFPHFYALAMLKEEEYRTAGIPMLPVVKGGAETKRQILLFVLMMLPSSLLLFATGVVGWIYFATALILGSLWIFLAFRGLSQDVKTWARHMFLYSLLYLTLMQAAMFLDPVVLG